jgi:hypothetical protein
MQWMEFFAGKRHEVPSGSAQRTQRPLTLHTCFESPTRQKLKTTPDRQLCLGVVVMMVMVMVVMTSRGCLRRKRGCEAEGKNEPKQKLLHALL